MKIILASSNAGKVKEIKEYCIHHEVLAYTDFIDYFDIVEDGNSYKENALIKARAIYDKIKNSMNNFVVISDDSGISVPKLGDIPGIYSARFAGNEASDKDNLNKLIEKLKESDLTITPAYYTAAIAIVSDMGEFTVHGWMHGDVISEARGDKGFGYDPMFIPNGYNKTLGELDGSVKEKISHRAKALKLAREILRTF